MKFIDPIHECYFSVLRLILAGKCLFLNEICEVDNCDYSLSGNSCTQKNQEINFVYNQHKYHDLDTPRLYDSNNNIEKN